MKRIKPLLPKQGREKGGIFLSRRIKTKDLLQIEIIGQVTCQRYDASIARRLATSLQIVLKKERGKGSNMHNWLT
jgi:hypothetical protein